MLLHPDGVKEAIGYQLIFVRCRTCGHEAWVAPELWDRSARRHCRKRGSDDYEQRLIWRQGKLPENVVPLKNR